MIMSRLDRAIQIAVETHSEQTDLGGYPYMLHPLRVLCAVESHIRNMKIADRESILCSAVLHDVIEDSKYRIYAEESIKFRISDITFKTVKTLSRNKEESWNKYINRVNEHWAPRIIKICDLKDNLDNSRLKEITDIDLNRNRMYTKALIKLQKTEEK